MSVLKTWQEPVTEGINTISVDDGVKYPVGAMIRFTIRSSDSSLKFTDSFVAGLTQTTSVMAYWMNNTGITPLVYKGMYFLVRFRIHGYAYRRIVAMNITKYYSYGGTFYLTFDYGNSIGNPIGQVVCTDRMSNSV
jgi:hypothetical protein